MTIHKLAEATASSITSPRDREECDALNLEHTKRAIIPTAVGGQGRTTREQFELTIMEVAPASDIARHSNTIFSTDASFDQHRAITGLRNTSAAEATSPRATVGPRRRRSTYATVMADKRKQDRG